MFSMQSPIRVSDNLPGMIVFNKQASQTPTDPCSEVTEQGIQQCYSINVTIINITFMLNVRTQLLHDCRFGRNTSSMHKILPINHQTLVELIYDHNINFVSSRQQFTVTCTCIQLSLTRLPLCYVINMHYRTLIHCKSIVCFDGRLW